MGDSVYVISALQTFIRLFSRANSISLHMQLSDELIPELRSLMDDADISHADGVHTARVHIDNNMFGRKILAAIPNVEVLEMEMSLLAVNNWLIDTPMAGHRLRSLRLTGHWSVIPLDQVLHILDRAPLLETLKVPRIFVGSSVGTLRMVTHARLSMFHLAHAKTDKNDAVFGHLTLPALRFPPIMAPYK
ncbi:hypothetical protein CPB85DRAFT_1436659 [Mucidula mucida]|nr:hypothetical protein CPB85DRAFT_1436659 [Mucidula mucida]